MRGVTYEGIVRYLRDHEPNISREKLQTYFAPEDREEAGKEYDRQSASRKG